MSRTVFLDTLEKHYRENMRTNEHYRFAAEKPDRSVETLKRAALRGHLAYEGPTCRAACNELGIGSDLDSVMRFIGQR